MERAEESGERGWRERGIRKHIANCFKAANRNAGNAIRCEIQAHKSKSTPENFRQLLSSVSPFYPFPAPSNPLPVPANGLRLRCLKPVDKAKKLARSLACSLARWAVK